MALFAGNLFAESIIFLVILFIFSCFKIVKEYERGVRFTFGKYTGIMQPGLRIIIPLIQSWQRVDVRIITVDIPSQDCISKDNISIRVNAVLYYKVRDTERAVLDVEHYGYAVSQLAQTTMRNIVGEFQLDDILQKREAISKKIKTIVDQETDPWGIDVQKIEIKDIELPQEMKRVIGKEAEAEREKRAVIVKAEGESVAAKNMAKAAHTLSQESGAFHLRTLQTLNALSSDKSNTIVLALPLEILKAFEERKKGKKAKI